MKKDVSDIGKLIIQADESVSTTESVIPNYTDTLARGRTIQKRIDDYIKSNLSYSIASIRYKIDNARSLANRVPVAANFDGTSSASLSSPILEGETQNDVSMDVKTNQKDGLLLYLGDSLSSTRRKRQSSDSSGNMNYLALLLQDGFVVFEVGAGSTQARVKSKLPVSDGQWYSIKAVRYDKLLFNTSWLFILIFNAVASK